MEELTFHFDVEEGFDAQSVARTLSRRIEALTAVEKSETAVENERFGVAEAIAVVSAVIVLTKNAREGVDELKKLITSLKEIVREIDGLKGAVLDIAGRRISLDEPDKALSELKAAV